MSLADVHDKPGHLIRRCQQIAVALFLHHCGAFDLTPMQYAVMRAVEAEAGIDQITLAGLLALDRSNVARLCGVLEERGLLHRLPDPRDRRSRRLTLTTQGETLLRDVEPAVRCMQDDLLSPLAAAERTAFIAALQRIAEAHNEHSRAPLRRAADDDAGL